MKVAGTTVVPLAAVVASCCCFPVSGVTVAAAWEEGRFGLGGKSDNRERERVKLYYREISI